MCTLRYSFIVSSPHWKVPEWRDFPVGASESGKATAILMLSCNTEEQDKQEPLWLEKSRIGSGHRRAFNCFHCVRSLVLGLVAPLLGVHVHEWQRWNLFSFPIFQERGSTNMIFIFLPFGISMARRKKKKRGKKERTVRGFFSSLSRSSSRTSPRSLSLCQESAEVTSTTTEWGSPNYFTLLLMSPSLSGPVP